MNCIPFGYIFHFVQIYLKSFSSPVESLNSNKANAFALALAVVDTAGKISNQLKEYLERFLEYYNTSPKLQEVL